MTNRYHVKSFKLFLRIITVISYFLPFTFFLITCNGSDTKIAYNTTEAAKNEWLKKQISETPVVEDSSILKDSLLSELANDQIKDTAHKIASQKREPLFSERLEKFVIAPTDSSLSGVGSSVYFKNVVGRIFITCSIFLSLITLIFWRWLKKKSFNLIIQVINICFVAAFVITCFVSEVDILFGTWLLMILLLTHIILDKKFTTTDA